MYVDDNETSSGRVKGSIKDRLISFLFRKRFKIKFQRNCIINKPLKITFIKKSNIKAITYRDLNKIKDKVIPVDVKTEKFDFDKYDYYIIEPLIKKGLDDRQLKNHKQYKNDLRNAREIINFLKYDLNDTKDKNKLEDKRKELIKRKEKIERDLKKNMNINIDLYSINNLNITNSLELNEINKQISLCEEEIAKYKKEFNDSVKAIRDRARSLKEAFLRLNIEGINLDFLDNIDIKNNDDIEYVTKKLDYYHTELENYENNMSVIESINTSEFINPIGIESDEENVEIVDKHEDLSDNKKIEKDKKEINKENEISLFDANEKKLEEKKQEINDKYNKKVVKKIEKDNVNISNTFNKLLNDEDKEIVKIPKHIEKADDNFNLGNHIESTLEFAKNHLLYSNRNDDFVNSYIVNQKINNIKRIVENELLIKYDYNTIKDKLNDEKNNLELTQFLIDDSIKKLLIIKMYSKLNDENYGKICNLEKILRTKEKEIALLFKIDKLNNAGKVKVKENKQSGNNNY